MITPIKQAIIVDVKYGAYKHLNHLQHFSIISTDPHEKTPYDVITPDTISKTRKYTYNERERYCKNDELEKGTMIDLEIDKFRITPWTNYGEIWWSEKTQYSGHSYELAVVMATRGNDLLVYGNKIGEHIIDKDQTSLPQTFLEIKRGDELLLEVKKRIFIVNNITMAKLKFDMMQNGPKIR